VSFDIEGWIEVACNPDTADVHAWFGVVRLSSIIDVADDDTERLFGLSKLCVSGKKSVDALAADRGVPPNPSAQVRRELEEIAAHEVKYGPGEFGGYTFATWSEIQAVALTDPPEGSQWKLPFALARDLEAVFGPERVRFVVWFCW
jgi:hypothetical protein